MADIFTLTLEGNEMAFVLQTIRNLPTQAGAWPLLVKLEEQVRAQMPPPEEVQQPTE